MTKLKQQVHSRSVGFLLGAGSSFLDGAGYPLAAHLWEAVKPALTTDDHELIEKELNSGCNGLEEALDRLDDGAEGNSQLRHRVASAVAEQFRNRTPPLDHHQVFARGLSLRRDRRVPIFNLNYDPLVESAADAEGLLLIDGFWGINKTFFHPQSFDYRLALPDVRRGRSIVDPKRGIISLYKLHGSTAWFIDPEGDARRARPEDKPPEGARLLMIPPHHRKAQDTGFHPYSTLWSEFRGLLVNDQRRLLNRLICVGYSMRDTHVNPVLNAACARANFTLVILTKELRDEEFNYWKNHNNVIIATETRCALYREEAPGIPDLWSFEWLAKEVKSNA